MGSELPALTSCNQKDAGTSKENYEEFRHQNLQPENPCSALIQTLQSLTNCLWRSLSFFTFNIPENLLLCFCAYPEVLSLGRTHEKCFILTKVHTDSPSHQETQPDQALLETAYGTPQRYLWQMWGTGCCFPWKCAQNGLTSEYSHSYGRQIQLTKAVQAHLLPSTLKEVQNFLVSHLQPSDTSESPFKISNSHFECRAESWNQRQMKREGWLIILTYIWCLIHFQRPF